MFTKINNTFTDNGEDLDIVMPIYNFLKYSNNYFMTSGSQWNYNRDEINDDEKENDANENMVNNNKIMAGNSFKDKTKIIRQTPNNGNIKCRSCSSIKIFE